jgi:chromosome segregation ATPase
MEAEKEMTYVPDRLLRWRPNMPLMLITSTEWNALVSMIEDISRTVQRLDQNQQAAINMRAQMAQSLDDIITDIADLGTKEDGLVALVHGLKDQLAAVIPPGTLTAEQQAKVDQIFAAVEQRKAAIQAALDEGTPPSPPQSDTPPADAPQVNPLSGKK